MPFVVPERKEFDVGLLLFVDDVLGERSQLRSTKRFRYEMEVTWSLRSRFHGSLNVFEKTVAEIASAFFVVIDQRCAEISLKQPMESCFHFLPSDSSLHFFPSEGRVGILVHFPRPAFRLSNSIVVVH